MTKSIGLMSSNPGMQGIKTTLMKRPFDLNQIDFGTHINY